MTTIEHAALRKYGDLISALFEIESRVYDRDKPEESAKSCQYHCAGCDMGSGECEATHLNFVSQTGRGLGNQLYLCPKGLSFIAVDFYVRSVPIGCLLLGPIQVSYSDQNLLPGLPTMKGKQFNNLQNLLHEIVSLYNTSSYSMSTDLSVDVIPNVHFRPVIEGYSQYSIGLENQLTAMVSNGLNNNTYSVISQLVSNMFQVTAGDASEVRKRTEEIAYLIAHAAINNGCNIPACFHETGMYHSEIKRLKQQEDFVAFLSDVIEFFSKVEKDNPAPNNKSNQIVKKVHEYIFDHYSEKISLDEAASYCNVSQSYLGNVLNANLGYTFTQYVNLIRIEKSKELLTTTDDPISVISENCGFSGQSYFAQVFKSFVGKGPYEFRKEAQISRQ